VANEEPNRSLLRPAVLVGIGVAGSLDEIVLHQLLRWHHLYDRGSQAGASNTLPYDLVFIGVAAVVLLAGFSCSGWPVRREPHQVGTVRNWESG
jgi:uncharacterized membrane protein